MSVTVILFFTLLWHYETASLVGEGPTPGTELSPRLGVSSLVCPGIADL